MPATLMSLGLLLSLVTLLVAQPDFGQTMLVLLVWGALFFMAGMRFIWIFGLGAVGLVGLFSAYKLVPHVAGRIKRFMDPASGDTFQVDTAIESFLRGGWFGRGPGEGTVKRILPDSHTDFVFAVAAEEFGIIICLALVALFSFIVIRALSHALKTEDLFTRLAASGLAILFGTQSAINMAVNLHLIPAKGMTLPFISYGGSSMISLAYGMGMLLALTRERPGVETRERRRSLLRARRGVSESPLILLAAGGTGGHLFPAEALGVALTARGWRVRLVTDARAMRYSGMFTPDKIDIVPSETIRSRNPLALIRTGVVLAPWRHQRVHADRPAQARRRHRLRRLSDIAAAGRGAAAARADRHSRRQRRDGPRQSLSRRACRCHRHLVRRHSQRLAGAGCQGDRHRQSDAAGGYRRRRRSL